MKLRTCTTPPASPGSGPTTSGEGELTVPPSVGCHQSILVTEVTKVTALLTVTVASDEITTDGADHCMRGIGTVTAGCERLLGPPLRVQSGRSPHAAVATDSDRLVDMLRCLGSQA